MTITSAMSVAASHQMAASKNPEPLKATKLERGEMSPVQAMLAENVGKTVDKSA